MFVNRDYEPQAITRDSAVENLNADGRAWHSYKDQVIYEKNRVLSLAGELFSSTGVVENNILR